MIEAITGESLSGLSSEPSIAKTHDALVAASAPVKQNNAIGKLDKFNFFEKGKVRVAGWLVSNMSQGPIVRYAYVLVMLHGTNN